MDKKDQRMKSCDERWAEVMELAKTNGFILQAYGGTAMLATQKVQLNELGLAKYLQVQKMNGYCPKEFGYKGCLDEDANLMNCGSCCLQKKGVEQR